MQSSGNDVREAWKYLEERFGVVRDQLDDSKIKKISGDYWLCSGELETGLNTETEGFRLLRETGRGLKPTTYALQFLGDYVTRNIVKMNRKEFLKLLKREEMIPREIDEEGYVALKYKGQIVGCGFYKGEKVSSRIPKGRGKELGQILED